MSTSMLTNSPLITQAARQQKQLTQFASVLGQEASTQKRNIGSISTTNVIIDAMKNGQLSILSGCDSAINNAIAYLQNAQASLQEQKALVQSALDFATQAATDPNLTAQLTTLNNQFMNALAQIQAVTTTTHDAAGLAILSGVIGDFAATAAADLALINPAAVAALYNENTAGVATTGAQILLANTALSGVANIGVTGNASVLNSLLNAAGIAQGNSGTISEYISLALPLIPGIAMDPAQISQQVADAIKTERIAGALPDLLARALNSQGGPGVGLAAVGAVLPSVIAYMTNSAIPAAGAQTGAAAPTGADAASSAAFANLLSASDIASLKALMAVGSMLAIAETNVGEMTTAHLGTILAAIPAIVNVFGGAGNIIGVNGLSIAAQATPVAAGAASIGAVAGPVAATAAEIGGSVGTTAAAMTAIRSYITTAALNFVNAAVPQKYQVGLNATDTVQLQIDSSTQAALGLSTSTITSVANAQASVTSLLTALQRIANNLSNINSQVNQLTARDTSINTQIDSLSEQISMIEDTDPVENASQLNDLTSGIVTIGALIAAGAAMKQMIAQSAQRILNG